jgi:hypothetical protein
MMDILSRGRFANKFFANFPGDRFYPFPALAKAVPGSGNLRCLVGIDARSQRICEAMPFGRISDDWRIWLIRSFSAFLVFIGITLVYRRRSFERAREASGNANQ